MDGRDQFLAVVIWLVLCVSFVIYACVMLANIFASRDRPPQAASLLEDRAELDRHPNIFICPKVGDRGFDVMIRQRKYGWDGTGLRDTTKAEWQDALYKPITSCSMAVERGHQRYAASISFASSGK